MFRKLTILGLVLALTTTAVVPRRSNAMVGAGLMEGGPIGILVGAFAIAGGAVSIYHGFRNFERMEDCSFDCRDWHFMKGLFFTFLGIVLLDQETGVYKLPEMTPELAQKYGIVDENLVTGYNGDLAHLNQIYAQMQAEYNTGELQTMQAIENRWMDYKDGISPEAFEVLRIMVDHQLNETKAAS